MHIDYLELSVLVLCVCTYIDFKDKMSLKGYKMTTISSTKKFTPTGRFNFIYAIEKFFVNRSVYKNTVSELSRLSDRELDDLGLCRADISTIASQAVAAR